MQTPNPKNQTTPSNQPTLYDFHKKQGAKFTSFAGWDMPVQYTSIIEEHQAVRKHAGLFDVSHMGQILLMGDDVEHIANILFTNNFYDLKNNQALYTTMCNEKGGTIDDVIVYRIARNEFLVCANAANTKTDIEWMKKNLRSFKCEILDVSNHFTLLALQGPKAIEILQSIADFDVSRIKRFHFERENLLGGKVLFSRTGYTGEDGFELYCEPKNAEELATTLLQKGRKHGLKLAGLGCRYSLRLEAGYPLYGHELSPEISPLEAGLSWVVKFDKFDRDTFIGQEALEQQKADGLKQQIIFFKLDDKRIPRQGMPIFKGEFKVGEVTSGTFSPVLDQAIGTALIQLDTIDDPMTANLFIDIRDAKLPMIITNPPFCKLNNLQIIKT